MGERRGDRNYEYNRSPSRGILSAVKQAGRDMLDGGQKKRLDEGNYYFVRESRLRDGIRAVYPLACLFGIMGVTAPLVWQAAMEIASEVSTQIPIPGTLNWLDCAIGAAGGVIVGALINAEHSRRTGKEWYKQSEDSLEDLRRHMSRLL